MGISASKGIPDIKICSGCGRVVRYNSYFNAYVCVACGHYEEARRNRYEAINPIRLRSGRGKDSHLPVITTRK